MQRKCPDNADPHQRRLMRSWPWETTAFRVCNISTGSTSTCTDEVRQERDPNGGLSRSSRDLHNLSPTSHRASACGGPVQGASGITPLYSVHISYISHRLRVTGTQFLSSSPPVVCPRAITTSAAGTTPLNPKPSIAFLRRAPSYEVPPANAVFPFQTSSQPTSRRHCQENKLRMLVLPVRFRPNVPPNVDPHVTMSWSSNA